MRSGGLSQSAEAPNPGGKKMTDYGKAVLSVLVLAVLAVFAVEVFFFVRHGYFLAVRDMIRMIVGR